MAKTSMLCPFTQRLCTDCALYRGRHFYLSFCSRYRGYRGESEGNTKSEVGHPVELPALRNWVEPWAGRSRQPQANLKIKLKVINMESGETRPCEFQEARTWDWSNPKLVRAVGDIQITSWDKLVDILRYKADKGYQEVEIYEFPRFMLIAGG